MRNPYKKRHNLGAIFDKHVKCEFEEHDVDATMKTMVKEPYVHYVPILTGGTGYDGVYNFYKNDFVTQSSDLSLSITESLWCSSRTSATMSFLRCMVDITFNLSPTEN